MELSKTVVGDACRASRMDRVILLVDVSIHISSKKSIGKMATWARNLAGGDAMGLVTVWVGDWGHWDAPVAKAISASH